MYENLQQILENPLPSLVIVLNLIIIESLLSVDNAAVLATMVLDLPKDQRKKALKYGILGAYVFRGIALLFATYLVKFWFLKAIGGLYLLYLVLNWWRGKRTKTETDDMFDKNRSTLYRATIGLLGPFWSTVVLVELMDIAFSIDNVFAAVAFTDNIILVWVGVFIGILAMRFVATGFIKLMGYFPALETAAFLIITVLGVKLLLSVFEHYAPENAFSKFLVSSYADWGTSILTIIIFIIPILFGSFKNGKQN